MLKEKMRIIRYNSFRFRKFVESTQIGLVVSIFLFLRDSRCFKFLTNSSLFVQVGLSLSS